MANLLSDIEEKAIEALKAGASPEDINKLGSARGNIPQVGLVEDLGVLDVPEAPLSNSEIIKKLSPQAQQPTPQIAPEPITRAPTAKSVVSSTLAQSTAEMKAAKLTQVAVQKEAALFRAKMEKEAPTRSLTETITQMRPDWTPEMQARQEQIDQVWTTNAELNKGDIWGLAKQFSASFASGTTRLIGDVLKIGPNVTINTIRSDGERHPAEELKGFTSFIENVDAAQRYMANNVNRTGETNIVNNLESFAADAATEFDKGNYAKATGIALLGALDSFIENPVAAAVMFTESLPQMMAVSTKVGMGVTQVALWQNYAREYYDEFVKENGVPPSSEQQSVMQGMGFIAAGADVLSDRIIYMGVPRFNAAIGKLASSVGIPEKSVVRTVAAVLGSTVGEPLQEFASGATTEAASQYGVKQDTSKLDAQEIFLQGALEATAVGPVQAYRGAKDAIGGTINRYAEANQADPTAPSDSPQRYDNSQPIQPTAVSSTDTPRTARQIVEEFTTFMDQESDNFFENNPDPDLNTYTQFHDKLIQQIEDIQSSVENGLVLEPAQQERFNDAILTAQTLQEGILKRANKAPLPKNEEELFALYEKYVAVKNTIPEELNPDLDGQQDTEVTSESGPTLYSDASQQELKDLILYSMSTGNNKFTQEQVDELSNDPNLTEAERAIVRRYSKSSQEVEQEIAEGTGNKFVGFNVRLGAINAAIAEDNEEAANTQLNGLKIFASYEDMKVKALREVQMYNNGQLDAVPESVDNVQLNTEGKIASFNVNNPYGFKPPPIQFFGTPQLYSLINKAENSRDIMQEQVAYQSELVNRKFNPEQVSSVEPNVEQSTTAEPKPKPELGIVEHPSAAYNARTETNVQSGDVTIAFARDHNSLGEKATKKLADKHGKPFVSNKDIDDATFTQNIINSIDPKAESVTLNVAGNGIYSWADANNKNGSPVTKEELYQRVYDILAEVKAARPNLTKIVSGGQTGTDIAGIVAAVALGIDSTVTYPKGFKIRDINKKDINTNKEQIQKHITEAVAKLNKTADTQQSTSSTESKSKSKVQNDNPYYEDFSDKSDDSADANVPKTNKYLLDEKQGFYATADQAKAIDQISDWLKRGYKTNGTYSDNVFVLEGRGGTGKTSVIQSILRESGIPSSSIAYTATTNKARIVLQAMSGQITRTIHKALGLKVKEPTSTLDKEAGLEESEVKLDGVKLLVIDEASMLGEAVLERLFTEAASRKIPIIFMGDSAQAPPIRTDTEEVLNANKAQYEYGTSEDSPVFQKNGEYKNRFMLTKVKRQAEGNPIKRVTKFFTDLLDDATQYQWPDGQVMTRLARATTNGYNPIEDKARVNIFDGAKNAGIQFTNNLEQTIKQFIEDYKQNPIGTRFIAFYNHLPKNANKPTSVYALNKRVFEALHPDRDIAVFEPGDILMSYSGMKLGKPTYHPDMSPEDRKKYKKDTDELINSAEYEVISSKKVTETISYPQAVKSEDGTTKFEEVSVEVEYNQTVLENILTRGAVDSEGNPLLPERVTTYGAVSTEQKAVHEKLMQDIRKNVLARLEAEGYTKEKAKKELAVWIKNNVSNLGISVYADLQHAFAITAWKAQGSTYRNAYVMEGDLISAVSFGKGSAKAAYQVLYVATSRPTSKLVMFNKNKTAINEAVDISKIDYSVQEKNNVTVEEVLGEKPAQNKEAKTPNEGEDVSKDVNLYPEDRFGTDFTVKKIANVPVPVLVYPADTTSFTSLAATTKDAQGNRVIKFRADITVQDVLDYFREVNATAQQKAVMLNMFVEDYKIDLENLISNMTDAQARRFIMYHEIGHINDDVTAQSYFSNNAQTYASRFGLNDPNNKYLADSALEFEISATLYAINTMLDEGLLTQDALDSSLVPVESVFAETLDLTGADAVSSNMLVHPELAEFVKSKGAANVVLMKSALNRFKQRFEFKRNYRDIEDVELDESNEDSDSQSTEPSVVAANKLSVFTTERDFFSNMENTSVFQNASRTQKKTLRELKTFYKNFEHMFANTSEILNVERWNDKGFNNISKHTTDYFLSLFNLYTFQGKEEGAYGAIEQNYVAAMATVGLRYIMENHERSSVNDFMRINGILGRDKKHVISSEEWVALGHAGQTLALEAKSLGKDFADAVGIKPSKNLSQVQISQMYMSFGEHILVNLQHMGYLDMHKVNMDALNPNNTRTEEEQREVYFVRFNNGVNPNIPNHVENVKALGHLYSKFDTGVAQTLNEVIGVNITARHPRIGTPAIKTKASTYLRKTVKLPKRVLEYINKAQSLPWTFKPEFIPFIEAGNRKFFRDMLGYRHSKELEGVPNKYRLIEEGKNELIDREINELFTFYKIWKETGNLDFFFEYNTWSNGRDGIASADFNPQNNKLIRHAIMTSGWEAKIDRKNKEHMINFQYAIGLGFGVKTDKLTPNVVVEQVNALITDPVISAGIKATEVYANNPKDTKARAAVQKAIKKLGHKTHTFDAMLAANAYLKAVENGETEFTVRLPNESDAVTSGVILGLLLAGKLTAETKAMLEAGGVFFGATQSYSDWKTQGLPDNYETLRNGIQDILFERDENGNITQQKSLNEIAGRFEEFIRSEVTNDKVADAQVKAMKSNIHLLPEIHKFMEDVIKDRSVAKDPVMHTNYGASILKASSEFVEKQLRGLYERLANPDDIARAQALQELKDMNLGVFIPKNLDTRTQNIPPALEKAYKDALSNTYGLAFRIALSEYNADYKSWSETINLGANAVSWLFRAKLKELIERKYPGKDLSSFNIPAAKLKKILGSKELKPYLPMFKTPYAEDRFQGLDFSKTRKVEVYEERNTSRISYRDPTTGKITKLSAYPQIREYTDPGASALVKLIQNFDATLMGEQLLANDILSAFDAVYANLLKSSEHSQKYSKDMLHHVANYSVTETVYSALKEAVIAADKDGLLNSEYLKNIFEELTPRDLREFMSLAENPAKTLSAIVASLTNQLAQEQANKPEMLANITNVDHMVTYNSSVSVNNPGNASIDSVDLFSEQNSNFDTFTPERSIEVTDANVMEVYNNLDNIAPGNITITPEHNNLLSSFIENVVSKVYSRMGPKILSIQQDGDTSVGKWSGNSIQVLAANGAARSLNSMSVKEVVAHEMSHSVLAYALSDPENARLVREATRLQKETRLYLSRKYNGEGWKVFLHHDDQGNPQFLVSEEEETNVAKARYNYIFNNKNVASDNVDVGLHEFMAHASTNLQLHTVMEGFQFTTNKVGQTATFAGRIENLFLRMFDWISGKIGRTKSIKGNKALIQLVGELTATHKKATFHSERVMTTLARGNTKVVDTMQKIVWRPMSQFVNRQFTKPNVRPTVRMGLIALGAMNPLTEQQYRKHFNDIRRRMGIANDSFAFQIWNQMFGSKQAYMINAEKLLLEAKRFGDIQREQLIEAETAVLLGSFKAPISKMERESLTRGFLAVDATVLVDKLNPYTAQLLADIYRNKGNVRKFEIQKLQKQLTKYGRTGNYYINQARALGVHMATGKVEIPNLALNAYNIANGILDNRVEVPADVSEVEDIIDRLATLEAIDRLTGSTRKQTADVIEREFGIDQYNGISQMFGSHKAFKADSLEHNFGGDKTLTTKGYIKEIHDPHIAVRIGTLADEARFAKEGFIKKAMLKRHHKDNRQNDAVLYHSTTAGLARWNRGVISTEHESMKGSSIRKSTIDGTDDTNFIENQRNFNAIKKAQYKEAEYLFNVPNYTTTERAQLVPALKSNAKLHDYRYMMTHHTKEQLFGTKMDSVNVLAHMQAGIVSKEETKRINRKAIDALYEDSLSIPRTTNGATDFVELGPDSSNEKMRELYYMLPGDARQYLKEKFGNNPVMVRKALVQIMFGERSVAPFKRKILRIAEAVLKEVVQWAKVNIVIRNPAVITVNVISNTMVGVMSGVPVEAMIKLQLKGMRELHNYLDANSKIHRLDARIAAAKQNNPELVSGLQQEKVELSKFINNSAVKELMDANLFQTIAEDVNLEKESDGYIATSFRNAKVTLPAILEGENLHNTLKKVNDVAFLTKDSDLYKLLMKGTQYSDFVARYAMHTYLTKMAPNETKMSKEASIDLITKAFVNYELFNNKYLQYLDDIGISSFVKYPMRIVRYIVHSLKNNPLNLFGLLFIQNALINVDLPTDASLINTFTGQERLWDAGTSIPILNFVPD